MSFLFVLAVLWAYVAASFLAGWVAATKGRNPFNWIVLSLFLNPLFVLVALAAVPEIDRSAPTEEEALRSFRPDLTEQHRMDAERRS
jgi:hypothetical protein